MLIGFDITLMGWLTIGISTEAERHAAGCQVQAADRGPQRSGCPDHDMGVLQFTVAIDIHICFVVNISTEESWETSSKWNDGPCALEEFGPLP